MSVHQLAEKLNLKSALWYASQGIYVFPIHSIVGGLCTCSAASRCNSPGKHPRTAHGFKDASVDPTIITRWFTQWPNSGVGISTGPSNLLVVDIDPRNRGDVSLADLPPLPHTPRTLTGGGGWHYFFRKPQGIFKCGSIAQGIDIKADGGYVAAAPSLHMSGTPYRFDPEAKLGEIPFAEVPDWLFEKLKTAKPQQRSNSRVNDGYLGAAFEAAGWLGKPMGTDRTAAKCPWNHEHSTGKPCDGSTVIWAPQTGSNLGWGHCSHSHCANRTLQEWLDAIPDDARALARERCKMDPDYTPKAAVDLPPRQETWIQSFTFNSSEKLNADAGNAALILAHETGWAGCIAYDEFRNTPVWIRQPPPLEGLALPQLGPCAETDWVFIQQSLRHMRHVSFKKDAVFDAVYYASLEQKFHPVRDFLSLISWDNIPRVDRWLSTYLGAEDTPYTRLVSKWWLISAIARIYEPGCKVDTIMVLEGPQGVGKSTALRILGNRWFCDTPIDLGNKDAYMILKGKWIVEWAEMEAFFRSEASRAKAFITSPIDTYRPPYRREVVDVPRQCVFSGSINLQEYLTDETGGRRQLPVECGDIDTDALARDVDMLWAEALVKYRAGINWWPASQTEKDICQVVQSQRYVVDEWETVLQAATLPEKFSSTTVLQEIFQFLPKEWHRGHEMRIAKCLKRLGYKQKRSGSNRYWSK